MRTRTLRACAWSMALLTAVVIVGCDEDRATPVAATPPSTEPHPNGPPAAGGQSGPNPISGNRKSTYGKAYDVAEDLVDKKIPDYHRRVEEELEKK